MQSDVGGETDDLHELKTIARSYFNNLFTTGDSGNYDHVLSSIDHCVSKEDNVKFTAVYTNEEIRAVVFEMGATKAPKEDGLLTLFYQKYWHIIGDEVTSFCLQILNGDMEVSSLNSTNIVLIPTKTLTPSICLIFVQ